MGDDLAVHIGHNLADTRHAAHCRLHLLAHGFDLGFGRITELDIEGNIGAINPDVLHRLAGDEILARIGVDRCSKRGLDLLFCKTHGNSGLGWATGQYPSDFVQYTAIRSAVQPCWTVSRR